MLFQNMEKGLLIAPEEMGYAPHVKKNSYYNN